MWSSRDYHLVNALGDIIRKKAHYLPFIKQGDGVEECFYGELVNLGYERLPNRRKVPPYIGKKKQPDFKEFEVKAATSTGINTLITEGFTQHPDTILLIVGLDSNGTNIKNLEKLKRNYYVLIGDIIQFAWNVGFSDKWVGVLIKKK